MHVLHTSQSARYQDKLFAMFLVRQHPYTLPTVTTAQVHICGIAGRGFPMGAQCLWRVSKCPACVIAGIVNNVKQQ